MPYLHQLRWHDGMRLRPTAVLVLGQKFIIEWDSPDLEGMGACEVPIQRIQVGPNQGHDQERDTLLHETLHACLKIIAAPTGEDEERIVAAVAPVLLDVLRANPDYTRWLIE